LTPEQHGVKTRGAVERIENIGRLVAADNDIGVCIKPSFKSIWLRVCSRSYGSTQTAPRCRQQHRFHQQKRYREWRLAGKQVAHTAGTYATKFQQIQNLKWRRKASGSPETAFASNVLPVPEDLQANTWNTAPVG
jgi:hypothetical protein